MTIDYKPQKRIKKFYQIFVIYLAMLVVANSHIAINPEPFSTNGNPASVAQIQPILLNFAKSEPGRLVRVIIQTMENEAGVKEQVANHGGKVLSDLPIIKAFVAEIEAGNVAKLGQVSGIRWISWDAPMVSTACSPCVDTTNLLNAYVRTVRADTVWNQSPYRQGTGIGIAVVDSGVNPQDDLYTISGQSRLIKSVAFNNGYNTSVYDDFGHGSHVAGVIAGNGRKLNGTYIGVAPMANIINVKVGDDLNKGQGTTSTVIAGLQWILQNKSTYNIRVVNMSLNSTVAESYHTNPIDAAVEILWFNKIVVVVSAGNAGAGAIYPPANDPFVITVGATDDRGTSGTGDDIIPAFSAYGTTIDGFKKPDLVAPGTNIVGLTGNPGKGMQADHPANVISNGAYFKMSGTSTAAPVVAGAIALLLEDEPGLTPDQVKYRLLATANKSWAAYNSTKAGAGYLNIYAAITSTTTQNSNTGIAASALLRSGSQPITWNSATWNSVNWNSVNWNSVNWNSVNWNSVNWNSDYWGSVSGAAANTDTPSVVNQPQIPWDANIFVTEEEPVNRQTEEQRNNIFLPLVSR